MLQDLREVREGYWLAQKKRDENPGKLSRVWNSQENSWNVLETR